MIFSMRREVKKRVLENVQHDDLLPIQVCESGQGPLYTGGTED